MFIDSTKDDIRDVYKKLKLRKSQTLNKIQKLYGLYDILNKYPRSMIFPDNMYNGINTAKLSDGKSTDINRNIADE